MKMMLLIRLPQFERIGMATTSSANGGRLTGEVG